MAKTKELTPLQAAQQRYFQTDKGKAALSKYKTSDKGKATNARYHAKAGSRAEYWREYRAKKKALKENLTDNSASD